MSGLGTGLVETVMMVALEDLVPAHKRTLYSQPAELSTRIPNGVRNPTSRGPVVIPWRPTWDASRTHAKESSPGR